MANKPGPVALYAAINPKKYARNAVRVALDNGRLQRQPCAKAGADCRGKVQAHHKSYEPERWLDVEWLCVGHHAETHRGEPRKKRRRASGENRTHDRSITNRVLYL